MTVLHGPGSRRSALCVLSICALLGCGGGDSAPAGPADGAPVADPPADSERVEPEAVRFELAIADRSLVGGERTLRVLEGQRVELVWSVAEPVTIHVHGYDLELALEPGSPRVQSFVASATGRFPVTAHGVAKLGADGHSHAHGPSEDDEPEPTLVYLEVHPR